MTAGPLSERSYHFWHSFLLPEILHYYGPACLSSAELSPGGLQKAAKPLLTGVVRTVCELVGAELAPHCERTLDDLTSEEEGEKEFCFTPSDIVEILPRVSV